MILNYVRKFETLEEILIRYQRHADRAMEVPD